MKMTKLKAVAKSIFIRKPKIVPLLVPVLESELLIGRCALVTGGTSGIGRAIAKAFVKSGAKVCITSRERKRAEIAAEEIVSEINGIGRDRLFSMEMDNRKVDDFARNVNSVQEMLGGLDLLVNNAGLVKGARFGTSKPDEFDEVLATNLKGAYFLSQCIAERWKSDGTRGNIINICSASSLRPGNSPYILSKWGLRSLTLGMARELIKYGIVVNGIAPGATATPHFVGDMSACGLEYPSNPSGRLASVEEIANLAVVLTSNMGRMVVGDILYATGGAGIITFDDV